MRPIGRLPDEASARRFGDFLYGKGIENQVDPTSQGGWEVWILDDDQHRDSAKTLLDQFRHNPDDPAFAQASRVAVRQRQQDQAAQVPKRTRMIDARMIFYTPPVPLGPLSIALIAISIVVTLLDEFQRERSLQTDHIHQPNSKRSDGAVRRSTGQVLPEVRRGQVWRLFTPMFLHFDILHILFNMLWLRDLGSMIEARKNSWLLLLLTLVLAGTSNLAAVPGERAEFRRHVRRRLRPAGLHLDAGQVQSRLQAVACSRRRSLS